MGKKEKEKYKEIHRYTDISDKEMEKDVEREREREIASLQNTP